MKWREQALKLRENDQTMKPINLSEDILAEQPALEWFRDLGYEVAFGPD